MERAVVLVSDPVAPSSPRAAKPAEAGPRQVETGLVGTLPPADQADIVSEGGDSVCGGVPPFYQPRRNEERKRQL